MKYIYRKEFGLTAQELEEEPVDEFFTNLQIRAFIKDKERLMSKEANNGWRPD